MKTAEKKILNRKPIDYLFDHILDGFKDTNEGLNFIKKEGLLTAEEYTEQLEKNAVRLVCRVKEFKIKYLLSIGFACLFAYMQISGDEAVIRKPSRTRSTRSGRRRNETEPT